MKKINIVVCEKCLKKTSIIDYQDIDELIWTKNISNIKKIKLENSYKKNGDWILSPNQYNKLCKVFFCPNCKKSCRYRAEDFKSKYVMAKWNDEKLPAHRVVWLRHYGYSIEFRNKLIHHKNRIKSDNRIENLELLDSKEHSQRHRIDRIMKKYIDERQPTIEINKYEYIKKYNSSVRNFVRQLPIDIKIWELDDQDKSDKQISEILGFTVGTIQNRRHKFYERYKKWVENGKYKEK